MIRFVPVVVIPRIESDYNFSVPSLAEGDAMTVVGVLKEGDKHASKGVAVPERVSHTILSPAVDLCYHQDVVEEEHFSLMLPRPVFLIRISHFIEATVAHKTSVGHCQVRALGHYCLLHLYHLPKTLKSDKHMVEENPNTT